MKNIYDIFEQRKIDCLNCDFNNIMESFNELDYICNIFENEHYESLEEAFDFKEMKKKDKIWYKSCWWCNFNSGTKSYTIYKRIMGKNKGLV